MKTISIALTAVCFSCLAINSVRADHHASPLLSPKLASIQTPRTCIQDSHDRDLARERGQLFTGKMYHHQPFVVADRSSNDPNLTRGLVHTGKRQQNAAPKEQQFQLAPLKGK